MDRREWLQALTGVAVGASVSIVDIDPGNEARPALIVVELPGAISPRDAIELQTLIRETLADTPLAAVVVAVISNGARLRVIDSAGRNINRPIEA